MSAMTVTATHLEAQGFVPNNPRLPMVLYQAAFPVEGDVAGAMEKRFQENGWPPQWRDGIYDFDHYHTHGHEVLGIAAGSAELILGGSERRQLRVEAGDVLLLPAGTGHRCTSHSEDFLVVGAYPPGQSADIVRTAATPAMLQKIATLTFPPCDPVSGDDGPLMKLWGDIGVKSK